MRYLAIGFWTELSGNETFTLSRDTDSNDPRVVSSLLCKEANIGSKYLDTVLLVSSVSPATSAPVIVDHWCAANGDFKQEANFLEQTEEEEG